MDKIRKAWLGEEQRYEPLRDNADDTEEQSTQETKKAAFSYIDYVVFLLLGISMLWAWNMFLAAGPYFQDRFKSDAWIFENFQSAEIFVSTVTNMGAILILTRLQAKASYPKRIVSSLIINTVTFALLALFTTAFTDISARAYFAFLLLMIFVTSLATALCQNGVFSYVSGFGQPGYTQGIMTGQAVAGILPCIAQIVSVLSVSETRGSPDKHARSSKHGDASPETPSVPSSAALAYFITAAVISILTLVAFLYLAARNRQPKKTETGGNEEPHRNNDTKKSVSLMVLFKKLFWLSSAVFVTFAVTMVFPVFTQRILSVQPADRQPRILKPSSFIPLAFLFWNTGDLLGRLLSSVPALSLVRKPRVLLVLAVLRIAFVGLYHLCNIRGRGAIVNSDFFYLVVVQLLFGLTNGYLGSSCMIGATEWVEPGEREAAGGFMGMMLVAGLTVGSLASFFIPGT